MTQFNDRDIGDLAEEVLDTLNQQQRYFHSRSGWDLETARRMEAKLRKIAECILETLGRRQPHPARNLGWQLLIVDDDPVPQLPD